LTYGRANNVVTHRLLRKRGYTGKIYLIIDDTDTDQEIYKELYGDEVIVFNKESMRGTFDLADNFKGNNVVVFARNKVHDIAESLGLNYFLVLDDDYSDINIRVVEGEKLATKRISSYNKIFDLMIKYLDESKALTIAFGQAGDLIGGKDNANFNKGFIRKAMNSFFCKTDNPFKFVGRINEDTTTYTLLGSQGHLFLTIMGAIVIQQQTQKSEKGLTEIYLELGTYVKSFYSVMVMPSAVSVAPMGTTNMRLHHRVSWNNCVPKILSEDYKKVSYG
ncbi:MAG TPA: hypothetical protein VFD00_13440, partial [Thermoclostridium sp.]|nr:hypothetical protein [Thermoclostridium sp.]